MCATVCSFSLIPHSNCTSNHKSQPLLIMLTVYVTCIHVVHVDITSTWQNYDNIHTSNYKHLVYKHITVKTTYKFHRLDFFLPGPVWADDVPWIRSGCSREARIISVHRTASCSSISRSLYWLRSISTRAISTRVNLFR